jgi:hypothetical protein
MIEVNWALIAVVIVKESISIPFARLKYSLENSWRRYDKEFVSSRDILIAMHEIDEHLGFGEEDLPNLRRSTVNLGIKIDYRKIYIKSRHAEDCEKFLLQSIDSILVQMKDEFSSANIFAAKKKHLLMLIRKLDELKSGYKTILHGPSGDPRRTKPPRLFYTFVLLLPMSLLYIFHPHSQFFNSLLPNTSKPQPTSKCLQRKEDKKKFVPDKIIQSRLMSAIDDEGFNLVFDDKEKENLDYLVANLPRQDPERITERKSKSGPTESPREREKITKLIKSIDYYQKKKDRKSPNWDAYQSIYPLLHIFLNNLDIQDKIKNPYQIAVAIPFGPNKGDGPMPWSLGVLRGVDMAQKKLLGSEDKEMAPIVVVVNDTFDTSTSQEVTQLHLANFLSSKSFNNEEFLGLIGQMHQLQSEASDECYEERGFPVLKNNIGKDAFKFTQSLLPDSGSFSYYAVNIINHDRKMSNKALVVFYDGNDRSSRSIHDSINKISRQEHKLFDEYISIDVSKDDLVKKIGHLDVSNAQPFLTFNPSPQAAETKANNSAGFLEQKTLEILREFKKKQFNGTVYLGHYFVDQRLINNLVEQIDGRFSLNRLAPMDWRQLIKPDQKSRLDDYHKKYGNHYDSSLNWYVFNSFNSILLFQSLVEDEFLIDSKPTISDLRRGVVGWMSNNSHHLLLEGALPVDLDISRNTDTGKVYIKDGQYPVCLAIIDKPITSDGIQLCMPEP